MIQQSIHEKDQRPKIRATVPLEYDITMDLLKTQNSVWPNPLAEREREGGRHLQGLVLQGDHAAGEREEGLHLTLQYHSRSGEFE